MGLSLDDDYELMNLKMGRRIMNAVLDQCTLMMNEAEIKY